MSNNTLQNFEELPTSAKRKRVLAAVAQELVTSEDDDNVADGMDICDIMENHTLHQRQTTTSSALHALGETIRNTLLEINDIREQNRERRHRELLQILAKMAQQESPTKNVHDNSKVSNINNEIITNEQQVNNYVIEQDQVTMNSSTSKSDTNSKQTEFNEVLKSQKTVVDNATLVQKKSENYIKILPKLQKTSSNIQQVSNIKNANSKKELQNMRAEMLEIQRKKMEDRERKMREFLQMQNM
ncbi:uncharacterized protein LOC135953855 [Calliphora vicina]|uniref:uncharacterized protein LOC135953855 n=1 Tax=Calliphora vicina TaxID=7373 RepID=UPI00325ACD39